MNVHNVGKHEQGYYTVDEEDLPSLIEEYGITSAIVAIGDNWVRAKVIERLPLPVTTAISPSATIARGVAIGDGTVICPGAIIGPDCTIGRGCLINTRSSLDHDSVMEDYSSLAPASTTGGNVRIGTYSAICLGAHIIHRIEIGSHCVIGASSLVCKNVDSYSVVYGVPAKYIRSRNADAKYL